MRFGGHQTFYLREGWLHKGMTLLINEPGKYKGPLVFDHLGVGKNMALSIFYWLEATGLAEKVNCENDSRTKELIPTELGKLINTKDCYFTWEETWWILHINLVSNPQMAEAWYWFFNELGMDRFLREQALRCFYQYIDNGSNKRKPTPRTIERDLSCLINSYTTEIPSTFEDPEEDIWCPFRDLELLSSYRSTGRYVIQRQRRKLSASVVLYALEKCLQSSPEHEMKSYTDDKITDIRFFDLIRLPNNPQRIFNLSNDGFYEILNAIVEKEPKHGLSIMGLAGERQIRIQRKKPQEFIERMYCAENLEHA